MKNYKWSIILLFASLVIVGCGDKSSSMRNVAGVSSKSHDHSKLHKTGGKKPTSSKPSGEGSKQAPYKISKLGNLIWISKNPSSWGGYFVQTSNIKAFNSQNSRFNDGHGFDPIGNGDKNFTGSYDGGNYKISDLYISRPKTTGVGLFSQLTGTVKNTHLENVDITGGKYTGGLTGVEKGSTTVSGISVTGRVTGNYRTGGIIGACYSSGMSASYNTALVNGVNNLGDANQIGGLMGYAYGCTIKNAYNTSNVTGNYDNGGITGVTSQGTIQNTYNTGKVKQINNNYQSHNGGVVGATNGGSTFRHNYFNNRTSTTVSSGIAGTAISSSEMKQQSTFSGFDFGSIWRIAGNSYPYLQTNKQSPKPGTPGARHKQNKGHSKIKKTVININPSVTYQTIHEFGASDAWATEIIGQNWPQAKKERAARLLFSKKIKDGHAQGIGLSGWRFQIGAGRGSLEGSGYRSGGWFRVQESFLSKDGSYDWSKQKGSRWFMRQAKSYGVKHFTGFSTSPPYFMTKSGYTFPTPDINGYNLAPKNYSKYADFLAHVAAHFKQQGIPFDEISPVNEPQYDWSHKVGNAKQGGSHASNKEIANVTKAINNAFSRENVNTKIMIPEAGKIPYLYQGDLHGTENQIKAFWSPSSPYYIGNLMHLSDNVAGHSYYSNSSVSAAINHRKRLASRIKQINPNLEYRETEYSILGGAYQQGRSPSSLKQIDYGLWLDRIIFNDLTYGKATGWNFWTALNRIPGYGDHRYRFGLISWNPNASNRGTTNGSITPEKLLWSYGNFSRFVRPGMKRIEVENKTYPTAVGAGKHVMADAFVDNSNKLVIVIINYTDKNQRIQIGNASKGSIIHGHFEKYTTSEDKNLAKSKAGKKNISVPSKSITTLMGSMK